MPLKDLAEILRNGSTAPRRRHRDLLTADPDVALACAGGQLRHNSKLHEKNVILTAYFAETSRRKRTG